MIKLFTWLSHHRNQWFLPDSCFEGHLHCQQQHTFCKGNCWNKGIIYWSFECGSILPWKKIKSTNSIAGMNTWSVQSNRQRKILTNGDNNQSVAGNKDCCVFVMGSFWSQTIHYTKTCCRYFASDWFFNFPKTLN